MKSISVNSKKRIVVTMSEFQGKRYLHVRNYYDVSNDPRKPEWKPSKEGVSVPEGLWDAFRKVVDAVYAEIEIKGS
jgi:hypothetical protein